MSKRSEKEKQVTHDVQMIFLMWLSRAAGQYDLIWAAAAAAGEQPRAKDRDEEVAAKGSESKGRNCKHEEVSCLSVLGSQSQKHTHRRCCRRSSGAATQFSPFHRVPKRD